MNLTRTALSTLPVALAALLALAPAAQAFTQPVSAPVTRGGKAAGRATALLITTDTGWAIANAKVNSFTAPTADAVCRAPRRDGSKAHPETAKSSQAPSNDPVVI